MKNKLKEKLQLGSPVFGTWLMTGGLETAEIIAHTGVDCVMIDAEHGAMSMETAGKMVSIMRNTNTLPMIRVAQNDIATIKQGIDTGVYGIMIPMINSKEEAEAAVKSCKYPPLGVRGVGASRAVLFATGAQDFSDYYKNANDEVLVILQIEHIDAVNNIDEILSVEGIDIAFVGPMDLSNSMGIFGQMEHPDLHICFAKVIEACNEHGVIPGIMTWEGSIQKHLDMGFKFLAGGMDSAILYNGVKKLVGEFKDSL